MKAFIKMALLTICSALAIIANGQVKTKTTAPAMNGQNVTPVNVGSGTTTVKLNDADMMSVVNGGQSYSSSASPVNMGQVADYQGSAALQKIAEETLSDKIFGTKSSYEYGITYWSNPVEATYNQYIAPYTDIFMQLNDEIYEGKEYKHKISHALSSVLTKIAVNQGIISGKEAQDKFYATVFVLFYNDMFEEDSEKPEYFEEPLSDLIGKTQFLVSYDKFWPLVNFLKALTTRQICSVTVQATKTKISWENANSQLSKDLYAAQAGFLFMPLTYYAMQKSGFGVYALKISVLQNKTNTGEAEKFYDKDCKCPTVEAFKMGNAVKVNSGSVISIFK